MVTFPVPKTIAFGAVATGSINAQDALNAAGSINCIGSCSADVLDKIGISREVVAVLDVISVRKVTLEHSTPIITHFGHINIWTSSIKKVPIEADNPVD